MLATGMVIVLSLIFNYAKVDRGITCYSATSGLYVIGLLHRGGSITAYTISSSVFSIVLLVADFGGRMCLEACDSFLASFFTLGIWVSVVYMTHLACLYSIEKISGGNGQQKK